MAKLEKMKPMTRWFNPWLLCRLIMRVIVSGMFSQYADRRLLVAALDTFPAQEHLDRADITDTIEADPDGAIWIDYVSDLGDGFDATYAIAYLLAKNEIKIGDRALPRGDLLVMGGDQVYPTSSVDDYKMRLRAPYRMALPDGQTGRHPLVYLIPGNHDWYDGLTSFIALFCREKPYKLGHWRTRQRRSYFALKLTADWWVWAIDIALSEDMDQPQADYFVGIAKGMPDNAKIILCTAEPGWYEGDRKAASFRCLDYAAWLADNAKSSSDPSRSKSLRIVAALSGDTHHYARYETGFSTQFVTSGGGGAFLHGTQSLKDRITLDWLKSKHSDIELAHCYPDRDTSYNLLRGNWTFSVTNWDFSFAVGLAYWLLAFMLSVRFQWDTAIFAFAALASGFVGYAIHQASGERRKALCFSLAHTALHFGVVVLTACVICKSVGVALGGLELGWRSFFATAILGIPSGWLMGGTLYGANLFFTARYFDMNHNDAFSAMRLDGYRHFLRLRMKGDELTIFPIALDRVPRRSERLTNSAASTQTQHGGPSKYLPPDWCKPHLIEKEIVIHAADVPPISSTVKPEELKTASPGDSPASFSPGQSSS